jgi:hypothetical protein
MEAVIAAERRLGRIPTDVGARKLGYDVESEVPGDGRLLFIEVKGRADGADTVTVTKNEILTALNMPDDFILAIVEVDGQATAKRAATRHRVLATERRTDNPTHRTPLRDRANGCGH